MADITFLSPATEEIILAAHIEVLSRAAGGTGVVEGNAMSPNGMDIDVDAGAIKIFGVGQDVDADSGTVGASDPVLDRIDLVTRDSAGDVVVLPGTPAEVVDPKGLLDWHQFTSPVPPSAIPAGSVILGAVHVAAAATSLGIGDIWEFAGRVPANVDLPLVTEIGDPGSDENVVSEKAIRTAVDALMPVSYLTTTITDPGSDAKVPSEKAVRSGLAARISTANIATSIDSPGVDTKVPSEKAVRTAVDALDAAMMPVSYLTTTIADPGSDAKVPSEKAVRTELDLRPLLSLLTSRGDIVYRNDTTWARLAKGPQYSVLSMGANDPAWTYLYSTRILVLPATAFNLDAANPPEEYLLDGTNQEVVTLAFDDTTEETAQAPAFVVPADIYVGGTVTFTLVGWARTAAANKNVQFRVKQLVLSSGEWSFDTAYSTASDSGNLACNATQDRPVIYTWTATVSSLGWSAGQRVRLAISRIAPSANNLTGDFLVESFEVRVPTRVM